MKSVSSSSRSRRADGKQGRRQTLEIGIEGRQVGIAPVVDRPAEILREDPHIVGVEDQPLGAPVPDARRQGEVVAAGEEVRAPERVEAVPVPQAQERHRREMGAGRLAADEQARGAEAALHFPDHPQGRRLAIVGRGRIGMLRAPAGTRRTRPRGRTFLQGGRARDPARPPYPRSSRRHGYGDRPRAGSPAR